jgi:NitT/TauT family transport system substrate-binding protein
MALTRRRLLRDAAALGALAVSAPLIAACAPAAAPSPAATAQPTATPLPAPETTTLRLPPGAAACDPAFWLVDDFLREEGFTDLPRAKPGQGNLLLRGEIDVNVAYANFVATTIDAGQPMLAVGGMHPGCLQLWARKEIGGMRDLRGKTTVVAARATSDLFYTFLVSLMTSVGVDPNEVKWIEDPDYTNAYFLDGKVDLFLSATTAGHFIAASPKNPGRVILDTAMDKPWSNNYCCLLVTNRDWAQRNPVAVKRMTRAFMRANDLGANDLASAARVAIDKKVFPAIITYDVLYGFLKDMSYDWREYDPDESLRFYALRLADGKLVKKTPQQIINDGTDLAYFRQLRKELKT